VEGPLAVGNGEGCAHSGQTLRSTDLSAAGGRVSATEWSD
jgi:hypothetical protein